jgi:hypothetical protein
LGRKFLFTGGGIGACRDTTIPNMKSPGVQGTPHSTKTIV